MAEFCTFIIIIIIIIIIITNSSELMCFFPMLGIMMILL
jgi:hypothetical protein